MTDESKDCQALVKYEPKPLTVAERLEVYAEKKRAQLRASLEGRTVADPITIAGVVITWQAIAVSAAASIAASLASMAVASAFAPKQKFTEERGKRSGDLVISAELGRLIPEVYFGMLEDGYGGSWVPAIVAWTSGIRKHVSTTQTSTGGGKFGGGGATTEIKETSYDLDWLLLWANKGPYRVLRTKANADIIYDVYGEVASYQGESASSYTAPYSIHAVESASGGYEAILNSHASGNGGIVQWTTVQSNGAATRQLSIYYRCGSSSIPIELTINGGSAVPITLTATNDVFLSHTVSVSLNDGANTVKIQNKSTTLNVGIDKIYCFPGHTATGTTTGVFDPAIPADDPYDPEEPPDPAVPYEMPYVRWDGMPDEEPTGGRTGTINHGGNAQFAIYPGNTTQLPDPTYEAAIDAEFGSGSTSANRGRCYEVDAAFYLTRWGGVIPNRIALLEHETIKKLSQMCAFMCDRVGMLAADRDFSGLDTVTPRGLRIMGGKFEAREPMASSEMPFDVVFAEQEGVLVGKLKASLSSVASLIDKDFGWSDDEETSDGPHSLIDVIEPNEIDLPRRVEVKYVDLDRDGEPGLQGYARQVTEGEENVTLDLQWTFTREEAQALAQKETYRRHVEKPCRYVLSWEHLWINVGDVFTATLSDGFTYTILHAKDSGGLGLRECEGILLDAPIFDQSAAVDPYGYETPVVPIPAMTIGLFLDTPLLRDGDETTNNGIGYYFIATPRTNSGQAWQGCGLYIERNGEWYQVADSNLPGTVGTVVSAVGLSGDTGVVDRTGVITVDLYGTTATLSSITEAQMLGGGNPAVVGDMVFNFTTATKLGGFPNRWELSGLLTGRRGTESHVSDTFTDKRFVFLDSAVKFVPALMSDLNNERNFRVVTSGQSLDDAADLAFTWTGGTLKPLAVSNPRGSRDSAGGVLIEFEGRTRVAGGLRSYQSGAVNDEAEEYRVQILNSGSTVLPNGKTRIMPVVVGTPMAAMLLSDAPDKFSNVTKNSLISPDPNIALVSRNARSLQTIDAPGNYIDATLVTGGAAVLTIGSRAVFGIVPAGFSWRNATFAQIQAAAHILIVCEVDGSYATTGTLYEYGVSKSTALPDGGRFRISFSGTEVRVYQNWTGSSGELVYSSPLPPSFPYMAIARFEAGEASVNNVMLTTNPYPKTIYSPTQHNEDFLNPPTSTGPPLQVDIWAESKLVGPGPKTRVTL